MRWQLTGTRSSWGRVLDATITATDPDETPPFLLFNRDQRTRYWVSRVDGGGDYSVDVSAPDIDSVLMEKFAALAGEAHLTLVLGAGASAPSGLPTWDEFAQRLLLLSGVVKSLAAANTLLGKQDPTIALEAAHVGAGTNWAAYLSEALYGNPAIEPSESTLHLAAAAHYAAAPKRTTLATLNFDTLLESALQGMGAPLVVIDTDGNDEPEVPTIHHLHGAVFQGKEYSAVVGYRDFANLVADRSAWQHKFLSSAVQRGPLLLAGTSFRDPDIRHWLHLILNDEKRKPKYPALVTIVREGLQLDRETFDEIDDALVSEWESIGLTALTVQDLADVALVIRELRLVGTAGYQAPAERARALWDSHTTHRARLQDVYADQLALDGTRVGKALTTTAHRATFWLANGRGKLARWVSDGTRYSSVRQMKFVPTGHDSPWIAGEAMGSEEVKLRNITSRDARVSPSWKSVLAVPIFVGDGHHEDWASAVVTFGMSSSAEVLLSRESTFQQLVSDLSAEWGTRLSSVAFPN